MCSHFGKIVRRVEVFDRLAPSIAINQFVEFGNAIGQRAADRVAKRHAAVHASCGLLVERLFVQRLVFMEPAIAAVVAEQFLDVHGMLRNDPGDEIQMTKSE